MSRACRREGRSNLAGEEIAADENDPDNAPNYAWGDKSQERMTNAHRDISRSLAQIEMFAPERVVGAAKELHSHVWLAEDYHRLAHELAIMETGPAENRQLAIAEAIHCLVDAARRDLGVDAGLVYTSRLRRAIFSRRS